MYSAIVRSIETGENTWESSFDRFESILYRRQAPRPGREREREPPKKWFCRDYNKAEGCNKTSPHKAQVGQAGITKTVLHMCAACWMREKVERKHPEGHHSCPVKD